MAEFLKAVGAVEKTKNKMSELVKTYGIDSVLDTISNLKNTGKLRTHNSITESLEEVSDELLYSSTNGFDKIKEEINDNTIITCFCKRWLYKDVNSYYIKLKSGVKLPIICFNKIKYLSLFDSDLGKIIYLRCNGSFYALFNRQSCLEVDWDNNLRGWVVIAGTGDQINPDELVAVISHVGI